MKPIITAIVVILIVAAAGAGAYYFLNNDDNGKDEPISYETLRTDIKTNDYIDYVLLGKTSNIEEHGSTISLFMSVLYPDVSTGEKQPSEVVKYKDKSITCDVYNVPSAYEEGMIQKIYIDPASKAFYKVDVIRSGVVDQTMALADTSLDLTKTKDQQIVSVGAMTKISMTAKPGSGIGHFDGTTTITSIDGDYCTTTVLQETYSEYKVKSTVESVDGDKATVITERSGSEKTTATESVKEYLSFISYKNLIDSFSEKGDKVEYGEKSTKTITTEFGKREVTVQKLTITSHGEKANVQSYNVYYGPNDVIYLIEVESGSKESGRESSMTMELKSSNLLS